jgi:hypothetical protein
MRLILFALLCFICCDTNAQNFDYQKDYSTILEQSKDKASPFFYDKLLQRFQTNDTTLTSKEVLALMVGFTGQPNYFPYEYIRIEREMYRLNDEKDFKQVIAMSDTFLATHPISQYALIERAYAFYKLGEKDSSNNCKFKFDLIMNAMASSGDGLTKETAVFAVSPIDGQNFIRKFLQMKIGTMGSGHDKNGNFLDILEVLTTIEGKEMGTNLYFQVEPAAKTLRSQLGLKKK